MGTETESKIAGMNEEVTDNETGTPREMMDEWDVVQPMTGTVTDLAMRTGTVTVTATAIVIPIVETTRSEIDLDLLEDRTSGGVVLVVGAGIESVRIVEGMNEVRVLIRRGENMKGWELDIEGAVSGLSGTGKGTEATERKMNGMTKGEGWIREMQWEGRNAQVGHRVTWSCLFPSQVRRSEV